MNILNRFFKKQNKVDKFEFTHVYLFKGTIYDVFAEYRKLLSNKVEIISTTLTQDFKTGRSDCFLLLVTYKSKI